MLTFVQLEYIAAVDSWRHFVTAAEKCHVTQPTLSMQLKKAEELLGITIFDRSRQPVVPTEAGLAVIERAREMLRMRERMVEEVEAVKGTLSGRLRIGVIPTLSPYLVPLFAGVFARKFPSIKLKIKELLTDGIEDALRTDSLDAGILATPLGNENLREKPLFYEELMPYVHPDIVSESRRTVSVDELPLSEILMLSEGHCFRHQVLQFCQPENSGSGSFQYESGSPETLRKLTDLEGGFTVLPELASVTAGPASKKRFKHFRGTVPLREISLVCNRTFVKEKLLNVLFEEIRKNIPAEMLNSERGSVVEWR